MPRVESESAEGKSPTLRRYIREPNGAADYESFNEQERKLRFTAAISHAGLVKLLQDKGGHFQFVATEETLEELFHYEVGIHSKEGIAELSLIKKPETGSTDRSFI